MKPKIAILITDGTNCDQELYQAFVMTGGEPEMVHINELLVAKKRLKDYQILGIPGGFTYGDDILSGKVLANEIIFRLREELDRFINQDKLIIGICNGFQVLVRAGLLPWRMEPAEDVSLIYNDTGHFECRWIKLKIIKSGCVFTRGWEGKIFELPVAHGEGKFVVKNKRIGERLQADHLIVACYTDDDGKVTDEYPYNPNGSYRSIAGICNATGRIFGLMPHPERHLFPYQHPNWQEKHSVQSCLPIFQNAVAYFS